MYKVNLSFFIRFFSTVLSQIIDIMHVNQVMFICLSKLGESNVRK